MSPVPATLDAIIASLPQSFEEPEKLRLCTIETPYVIEKYSGRERPYLRKLRSYLEQGYRRRITPGLTALSDIDRILELLKYDEYPLLEKVNLFIFYREWSSRHDLIEAARRIADECRAYIEDRNGKGRYQAVLSYFKTDLLAQLFRETDQRQRYVGLETFIEISSGFPRILLIILKRIFAWATFNGEQPFRGKAISMRSQQAGVLEAADWFYSDARMIGRDGQAVTDAVNRLGTLFRGLRYSEKPSECSCSTFSADLSRSSEAARHIVDIAEKWSLLIDVGSQRDRNTDRIDKRYQLNRVLAPRWDLSIYRRGVLALAPLEIDAIFDPEHAEEFDGVYNARIARMSAPFFGPRGESPEIDREEPLDLFGEPAND